MTGTVSPSSLILSAGSRCTRAMATTSRAVSLPQWRTLPSFVARWCSTGRSRRPTQRGVTHLDDLNEAIDGGLAHRLAYYGFDLLHLDGFDLTGSRLEERKALLADVLHAADAPRVVYVDHVEGDGTAFFDAACGAGAEGEVSERRGGHYRAEVQGLGNSQRHKSPTSSSRACEQIARLGEMGRYFY
jgi:hypothetical protein